MRQDEMIHKVKFSPAANRMSVYELIHDLVFNAPIPSNVSNFVENEMMLFFILLLLLGLVASECVDNDNFIQCCTEAELGFINLDGCADMILDWDDLDITLQLELNGVVLFDTTFGFDRQPELCVDVWGVNICLLLDNLDLDDWKMSGCLDLVVNDVVVPLGCFQSQNGQQ